MKHGNCFNTKPPLWNFFHKGGFIVVRKRNESVFGLKFNIHAPRYAGGKKNLTKKML